MPERFGRALLVAALSVLATGPGLTAEGSATPEDLTTIILMMDRDRNGLISRPEFVRHNARPGAFDRLDTDGNDMLDADEQQGVTIGPRRGGE
jgi:hypothetical protein